MKPTDVRSRAGDARPGEGEMARDRVGTSTTPTLRETHP